MNLLVHKQKDELSQLLITYVTFMFTALFTVT